MEAIGSNTVTTIGARIKIKCLSDVISMPSPRNMPAELPGLYWDEARNRYFPISSKPKQQNPPSTTAKGSHQSIRRRRSHTLSSWRTNDIVRGTWNYCLRERLSQCVFRQYGRYVVLFGTVNYCLCNMQQHLGSTTLTYQLSAV